MKDIQNTGYKDKNGLDIYTGNCTKYKSIVQEWIVEWRFCPIIKRFTYFDVGKTSMPSIGDEEFVSSNSIIV